MAQDKKSFIAYSDWKETFDALPDDKAGQLIKHIFAYVNDEDPKTDDILINAVFVNIKNTLKRDLKKWETQYNQRVSAGRKSAEIRRRNAATVQRPSTTVNEKLISSTVSVSVSESVNDNVSVIKEKIKPPVFNFKKSFLELGVDPLILEDWLEVRKKKKAVNSQTAFNGLLAKFKKAGKSASECIKIAAENSWKGFDESWLQNTNNGLTNGLTVGQILRKDEDKKRDY